MEGKAKNEEQGSNVTSSEVEPDFPSGLQEDKTGVSHSFDTQSNFEKKVSN